MSWACINLDPGLPHHPKIIQLEAVVGEAALAYVLRLWCWAAIDCPDGMLGKYDNVNFLERRIMRWEGESGELLAALFEAEIVKLVGDVVAIHNWNERNPHLKRYRERQRAAAKSRWAKVRAKNLMEADGQS